MVRNRRAISSAPSRGYRGRKVREKSAPSATGITSNFKEPQSKKKKKQKATTNRPTARQRVEEQRDRPDLGPRRSHRAPATRMLRAKCFFRKNGDRRVPRLTSSRSARKTPRGPQILPVPATLRQFMAKQSCSRMNLPEIISDVKKIVEKSRPGSPAIPGSPRQKKIIWAYFPGFLGRSGRAPASGMEMASGFRRRA